MTRDWCTLLHADAHAIIDRLRDLSPDAVVTDPPYGLGLAGDLGYHGNQGAYHGDRKRIADRRGGASPVVGDDGSVDVRPFLDLAPVSWVWGADHLRHQLPAGGRFVAWDKLEGRDPWDSFSDVEFAWCSKAGKSTLIRWLWKGLASRKAGEQNGRRLHPMQKPLHIMRESIRGCGLEPGALILDPYMGSCTTGIAAWQLGYRFVGVEIDRRWYDVAAARVSETCDGWFG